MKLIRKLGTRNNKNENLESWAEFICEVSDCGKIVERSLSNGKRDKSCGNHINKHGETGTKLYSVWADMKQRVLNPNRKEFKYYGDRGITICDDWLEYIPFRDWALNNGYKEGLIIDRINPNGNYELSNCRFLTVTESLRNKRNTMTMQIANEIRRLYNTGYYTQKDLANKYGVKQQTISRIINNKRWIE